MCPMKFLELAAARDPLIVDYLARLGAGKGWLIVLWGLDNRCDPVL